MREALQEFRSGGVAVKDITQPVYTLIERECPDLADFMTKFLCRQVNIAGQFAKLTEEDLRVIAIENLALGVSLGLRAKELETANGR